MSTPWPALLSVALSFGLTPDAFWRLSMREWRAISAPATPVALSRSALEAMVRAHPDRRHD